MGKTHLETLLTTMNMASTYTGGSKYFTKVEDTFRHALDGYEKSPGKDHELTKTCVRNLNTLLGEMGRLDEKAAL